MVACETQARPSTATFVRSPDEGTWPIRGGTPQPSQHTPKPPAQRSLRTRKVWKGWKYGYGELNVDEKDLPEPLPRQDGVAGRCYCMHETSTYRDEYTRKVADKDLSKQPAQPPQNIPLHPQHFETTTNK
eukprot:Sspe_Gene.110739::Locus_91802_Transcript_1_2_Confidence_0.667_Length_433::g.110739::m.110739